MTLTPVVSSNLSACGYDHGAQELTVEFKSGDRHIYSGVPPHKFDALMRAESVGKHFHAEIRNRHPSRKAEA